jgi:hypothetical protein
MPYCTVFWGFRRKNRQRCGINCKKETRYSDSSVVTLRHHQLHEPATT